jgi:osmoprotectant transport system ATP-binding protein
VSAVDIGFENVRVRYPGSENVAVDGVDLRINAGELVVLLGPSGCGKSTLLRSVNRLVTPESGRVLVGDRDVASLDANELRRGIGYAIQAVGLFTHMTVAENIAIVPSLLDWPRADIDARVGELLELIDLPPQTYRNRRPRELSGGQAQRVGVARAIAGKPGVLLMDEPFGAVDAIVRQSLQRELVRIVRTLKTTTLFVTHDVAEALLLADRVVVMRDGRVEQAAAPEELLDAPATPYVRDLVRAGDDVYRQYYLHLREQLQ